MCTGQPGRCQRLRGYWFLLLLLICFVVFVLILLCYYLFASAWYTCAMVCGNRDQRIELVLPFHHEGPGDQNKPVTFGSYFTNSVLAVVSGGQILCN